MEHVQLSMQQQQQHNHDQEAQMMLQQQQQQQQQTWNSGQAADPDFEDDGDDDDDMDDFGNGKRKSTRSKKPHLQGRFSGRLATKEDERRLAEECRLLAPYVGGVGKRGDRSRLTLAKIVRGIATGEVRRFCEEREAHIKVLQLRLAELEDSNKLAQKLQQVAEELERMRSYCSCAAKNGCPSNVMKVIKDVAAALPSRTASNGHMPAPNPPLKLDVSPSTFALHSKGGNKMLPTLSLSERPEDTLLDGTLSVTTGVPGGGFILGDVQQNLSLGQGSNLLARAGLGGGMLLNRNQVDLVAFPTSLGGATAGYTNLMAFKGTLDLVHQQPQQQVTTATYQPVKAFNLGGGLTTDNGSRAIYSTGNMQLVGDLQQLQRGNRQGNGLNMGATGAGAGAFYVDSTGAVQQQRWSAGATSGTTTSGSSAQRSYSPTSTMEGAGYPMQNIGSDAIPW